MYNYFNFNGVQVNELALVTKIEKPYIPSKTISTLDVTSRHGQIYDGMKYNAITIPISLAIIGDNEEDYKRRVQDLKDILETNEEVPIKFAPNCSIYGMLNNEFQVEKKNAITGYADIEIICHTPFTYGDNILMFEPNGTITKKVTVNYAGKQPTLPFISIGFTKDTHFAQIQNIRTGDTILVGNYPKIGITETKKSTMIVNNPCEDISQLVLTSANIDSGRSTNGSIGLSSTGHSYILSDMGDGSTTWKGACARVHLSKNLDEFKVRINMQHNSTGKNGDPNIHNPQAETVEIPVSGTKTKYYQVTCSSLNVRSGPGTSHKKLGAVSKGFKIKNGTLSKGWVKFKYNGKTGYCSETYLAEITSDKTTGTVQTYTVENMWVMPSEGTKANTCVPIKAEPSRKSKTNYNISYGQKVRVLRKSIQQTHKDSDGKTVVDATFYKLYKPYTDVNGNKHSGYIETQWLVRGMDMDATAVDYTNDKGYADDKTGTVEVYGFNVNGRQLFKMCLFDDNEYFEYTQPQVRIGNRVVLKDTSKTPKATPKEIATQNKVTTSYYLGGKHGDWNDFDGTFWLTRKKVNGQYVWDVEVQKKKDGAIVKTQSAKNLKYKDLPTDELSYLAIYIGTSAATMNKLSGCGVSDIKVYELNPKAEEQQNIIYFQQGDILDLDFENSNCYLNEELHNELVDIGSSYFQIDPGETEIAINSDDLDANMTIALREKWLGVVDEDIATVPQDMEDEVE